MTTKERVEQMMIADPWDVWPDGIIPAEGDRPAWRLRTKDEAKRLFSEMAASREKCKLPDDFSIVDSIREDRDER